MSVPEKEHPIEEEGPPPILKSWKNLYLLVLGSLGVQVILYYIITKIFE